MTTISVRIDDELKKKMKAHSDINWSGVVRAAIKNTAEARRSRDLVYAITIT